MSLNLLNDLGNYFITLIINLSIGGSILLLVIIILSSIFRQKVASFHYILWLVGLFPFIVPQGIPLPTFFEKNIQSTISMIDFSPIQMASQPPVFSGGLNWKAILFICWGIITLLLICYLIIENKRFKKQLLFVEPFHYNSDEYSYDKANRIFLITEAVSPFTSGLIFPKIYLPPPAKFWSIQELNFVIQHELAHIRRRDLWIIPIQAVFQILFFFHPILWFLNRRINYFRELSCDDYAIATTDGSGVAYSKFLLKNYQFQNKFEFACLFSSCFGQRSSTLMKRFHYLLNRKEQSMIKLSRFQKIVILGVLVLAVFLVGQNRTHASPFRSIKNSLIQINNEEVDTLKLFYDIPPQPIGEDLKGLGKYIKYPDELLKKGIEGGVLLKVFFDENGNPLDFQRLLAHELVRAEKENSTIRSQKIDYDYGMAEAAIEGIKKTKWSSAQYEGKPVGIWFLMEFVFRPQKELNQKPRVDVYYSETFGPQADSKKVQFVAYDKPPEPIGGFEAVQQNLVYPELAKRAGIEGTVYLQVLVIETGQIEDVKVVKSLGLNNGLDEAAIEAVKKIQWHPARQKDNPVKTWVSIPVRFKINKN